MIAGVWSPQSNEKGGLTAKWKGWFIGPSSIADFYRDCAVCCPLGCPMAVCPILSLLQKVPSCTFCTKLRCSSVRYFCIKRKRKISLFIVYSKVSAAAGISIFMQKHDLTAKNPNELSFQRLFQCSFWGRYIHARVLYLIEIFGCYHLFLLLNSWNPFLVCREKKLKKYSGFMFSMAQRLIEL